MFPVKGKAEKKKKKTSSQNRAEKNELWRTLMDGFCGRIYQFNPLQKKMSTQIE